MTIASQHDVRDTRGRPMLDYLMDNMHPAVIAHIDALSKTGLYGSRRPEVIQNLIEEGIRNAAARGFIEVAGKDVLHQETPNAQ